jgi:hypothetical protein
MIIGRRYISSDLDEYIFCRKWIFQKIHLDPNYLPRKISNIHFYNNRQKTKNFQFITPNLEFIYYLWLFIKMEIYKEEKIVSWSGKMRFSNHLPYRWISSAADEFRKSFFWVCVDLVVKQQDLCILASRRRMVWKHPKYQWI